MRLSQPQTIRSPNTMSREPGRRIQSAAPMRAITNESSIASTIATSAGSLTAAWRPETISAGSPATANVAIATCGR